MKLLKFLILLVSATVVAQAQPCQIYTSKGKKISFEKMTKELKKADVVMFGELHNNAIAHYFQVKVKKKCLQINKNN